VQKRTAQLHLTINGTTYTATGETIAEAAAELERQVAAAAREAPAPRWRPTPAGTRSLEAYRRLARRERSQPRAAIAAERLHLFEAEAKERQGARSDIQERIPESSSGQARDHAAAAFNVNPRYVQDAAGAGAGGWMSAQDYRAELLASRCRVAALEGQIRAAAAATRAYTAAVRRWGGDDPRTLSAARAMGAAYALAEAHEGGEPGAHPACAVCG
jgi:hypothetical protein